MKDSQTKKILRHLEKYGSITPVEAMAEYGIMRLGARIWDLRAEGYPIESQNTKAVNRFGETVHYATYSYAGKEDR